MATNLLERFIKRKQKDSWPVGFTNAVRKGKKKERKYDFFPRHECKISLSEFLPQGSKCMKKMLLQISSWSQPWAYFLRCSSISVFYHLIIENRFSSNTTKKGLSKNFPQNESWIMCMDVIFKAFSSKTVRYWYMLLFNDIWAMHVCN